MSTGLATLIIGHVVISLVGIGSGFVVMLGLIKGKLLTGWNAVFLVTTVATSLTGFLFPVHKFLPSHAVGILSLVVLGVAIFALYGRHVAGGWRHTFTISAVIALYLNFFVLIVQLFEKVPALKVLARTQTEAPFKFAQLAALFLCVVCGFLATKRFRAKGVRTA